jgi:NitT/TauT family transport system ATP-binding protein
MTDSPAIKGNNLGMTYPGSAPSLQSVDLTVERGEFVSIVGPSGCGKSTLLRLVAGLRDPTAGELSVSGRSAKDASTRSAFVFQDPNLLPWRNVLANIQLPFEIDKRLLSARRSDAKAKEKLAPLIREALELVGLGSDDAKKLPTQLSGGMRMRVSLARALVTQPELLLLDEPFAALDDILRQQLNEDVQRIWWQQRWTALFVTHNVAEAIYLSQRVLIMSRAPGRLVDAVDVPFEYPRDQSLRSSVDFARLTGEVTEKLRQASVEVSS